MKEYRDTILKGPVSNADAEVGCLFCSFPPHAHLSSIEELKNEGNAVANFAGIIEAARWSSNKNKYIASDIDKRLQDIYVMYSQWWCAVRTYLLRKKLEPPMLYENSGLHIPRGDLPRWKANQSDFYELVKLIREDVNTKLRQLNGLSDIERITIYIDPKDGIYIERNGKKIPYRHVTGKSKIFIALMHLKIHGPATLSELAGVTRQQSKTLKRGVTDFNKNAQTRFSLTEDPIVGDGVYELNQSTFSFR